MMLPKVYMIELKPESGAVYIEEHDMWVSDNSRFFKILRDGRIQQLEFGLVAHMVKTMHSRSIISRPLTRFARNMEVSP